MVTLDTRDIEDVLAVGRQAAECDSVDDLQHRVLGLLEPAFQTKSSFFALNWGPFGAANWSRFSARGLSEDFHTVYEAHFYDVDPFAQWLGKRYFEGWRDMVATNYMILPREKYLQSKIYGEFFETFGIFHILGITLIAGGRQVGIIALYRPREAKDFSSKDITKAKLIAGPVAAALGRALEREQLRERDGVIDLIGRDLPYEGVLVLDEHLQTVYRNSQAQDILAAVRQRESDARGGDWVPDEVLKLCEELGAAEVGTQIAGESGTAFRLVTARTGQQVSGNVRTLRNSAQQPRYVICLEPETPTLSLRDKMEKFGLTPREMDVVHLISAGFTNAQAADRLCISPYTVENHLRSVYAKVGVCSRTALLCRLASRT